MTRKTMLTLLGLAILVAIPLVSNAANIRPYVPGSSPEYSVQQIMDGTSIPALTGWQGYNAITDQSTVAYWSGDPQNLDSVFKLRIELSAWDSTNSMGLYSHSNPLNTLQIIPGGAFGPNASYTINWYASDPSRTSGFILGFDGANPVFTTFSGFSMNDFGLYFETQYNRWYSEDALNTTDSGNPHILAYQSKISPYNWFFAFEDMAFNAGSDRDFNDMIVTAESLAPVPEPGTMMLLGSGLVGLAGWGRKKFRK